MRLAEDLARFGARAGADLVGPLLRLELQPRGVLAAAGQRPLLLRAGLREGALGLRARLGQRVLGLRSGLGKDLPARSRAPASDCAAPSCASR